MIDLDNVSLEARKELARRHFYDYCQLKYPKHYQEDRIFLQEMCQGMQTFIEESTKRFLVVNVPPRHYKSFTGTNLVEWLFGKYRLEKKVISGSYNERLSTTFARKVRNTIQEKKIKNGSLVYRSIFPKTKIKYGQASASLWALDGSTQDNYLATSPGGTVTGFGANVGIIDDIIKNAKEAYNDAILEEHWDWFKDTWMSRFEGDDWKCIIIMTRWATRDLAGRVISAYPDQVETIAFSAVQKDGSMLCDSILNRESYDIKTQEMNPDIVEANYNQKPIDVKGRLYESFMTWETLPETPIKRNNTDVADEGNDFLCSINWREFEGDVYIQDIYFSDESAEITEPEIAVMLATGEVTEAEFESNNGGKGYARNIERELRELGNIKCVVSWTPQTTNKEARILASSAWSQKHIFMPPNWEKKYPKFYNQLMNYQKKGKNAHDDAPDVLATIYERMTAPKIEYGGVR